MIFINYRREDSAATAGRLHDRLAQVFGAEQLKGQGKKFTVLLVSNGNGDRRFVALNLGAPVTP